DGKIYGDGSQLSNVTGAVSGMTAGAVTFGGASSSSLISDSGALIWDITNRRLGIGGAASAKLQVATGADAVVGLAVKANSGSQSGDLFQALNSNGTAIMRVGSDGKIYGDGSQVTA